MTSLTYFTVTADYLPSTDRGTLWGTVEFTMMVQSGSTLAVPSLSIISVPVTVPATLGRGVLCDATGSPGVDLLANTAALNLTGTLYYQVTFSEVWYQAPGQQPVAVPLNSFTFAAPTSATTIDLSTVTPAAGVVAQQIAATANGDGTMSVTGVKALQPLTTVTIQTTSTAPVIGQTTYYNASSGNLTPTLPALSGLAVGARLGIRRDPADSSQNTVTLSCAGSDTFYSSGGTTATFPLSGEKREFQVISVAGTKYWEPQGAVNPIAALDNRYLAGASKLLTIGDLGYGTSASTNSTSTVGTSELPFIVGVAVTGVVAKWNHWYTTTSPTPLVDVDPAGSISFNASLRIVSSSNSNNVAGTIYRLTFGGRTTATLDPGGKINCDPLGITLNAGDKVAIRTFLSSGTAYATHNNQGTISGVVLGGGFTATTDLTPPGSAAIASSQGYYYGPSELLGYPTSPTTAKSVGVWGDSIGSGYGDFGASYSFTQGANGGFLLRALSGNAGLVNSAVPSDAIAYFQSSNGRFRRLGSPPRCNSAIIEYGTNDLAIGLATAGTVEAANLTLASDLRRLGILKVFLTTLVPRTTTTDGFATTANQTPIASESQRVAYNTWIRANCPINPTTLAPVAVGTAGALTAGSFGHPITGFFDTAATVESSLNSGLWAPCSRVATGSITAATTTLTSSNANFLSANQESGGDKGAMVCIRGAGASGADYVGPIQTVTNSTTVSIGFGGLGLPSTTVTNAQINMGVMTLEGIHPSSRGHYLMSQAINTALL